MVVSVFTSILVLSHAVLLLPNPSLGFQFYVGGRDGWTLNPSENYNHWSHRSRFQVNDTLYFKYTRDADSVLEVTMDDYDSCNNKSPMRVMNDGDTVVTLDRSGPYYFISGNMENCQKGQKLFLVVMTVRPSKPPPSHGAPSVSPVTPAAASPLAPSPQNPTPAAKSPLEPSPHDPKPPAVQPSHVSSSPAPGPSATTRGYAPGPAPMENSGSARSGLAVAVLSLIFVGSMQRLIN